MKTTCLYGGPIFDGENLFSDGSVLFSEEAIIQIVNGDDVPPAHESYNVRGQIIAPGLIDLHSDTLEKCIEARPGVFFDAEFALQNLDKRVAACGITTFCHALSFADNEIGLRSPEEAESLVRRIHQYSKSERTLVRHKVHTRYEIGSTLSAKRIEQLLNEKIVDMMSFMDHTPGQGQFKTIQSYVDYFQSTYDLTPDEIFKSVDQRIQTRTEGWRIASRLASKIHEANIPILSHDDDTSEKIDLMMRLGVTAAEFPVSMEAVCAAKQNNMRVFMGAPNLIRDNSSSGNLKASEAIGNNLCDGLISDYYPECLIQAPFMVKKKMSMELIQALKLVTTEPGNYISSDKKWGFLAPNNPADIVVIDTRQNWVNVTQTWVNGKCVYRTK